MIKVWTKGTFSRLILPRLHSKGGLILEGFFKYHPQEMSYITHCSSTFRPEVKVEDGTKQKILSEIKLPLQWCSILFTFFVAAKVRTKGCSNKKGEKSYNNIIADNESFSFVYQSCAVCQLSKVG